MMMMTNAKKKDEAWFCFTTVVLPDVGDYLLTSIHQFHFAAEMMTSRMLSRVTLDTGGRIPIPYTDTALHSTLHIYELTHTFMHA